jgi:glycosyltransferase involved in cell wall biosynthesis
MRVLMISKACIVGIYQRKLEEIAALGVELLALVPPSWRDERGEMALERAHTDGYRLETLPIAFNGSFHLHFYPGLARRIGEFRPQIVHIDEEPYNLSTWQALYHARRIGAKTLFFSWQNINRRYPPPFSWGERWVLRHADHAIVGTDSAGQVWRAKGYRGAMTVIPQFGVDPETFSPPILPSPSQWGGAGGGDKPFTIGYFGRLVEEKGVRLILRAAAQFPRESWRALIVGSGPTRQQIEETVARQDIAGYVELKPFAPSAEMPALYHQIDVFVLPSLTRPNWKEQFGRVLVEAMASGVP